MCIMQLKNMDSSDWRKRREQEGETTRERGQIKEGYEGATPHFQQSVADEKRYFRKVSRVTDEGEKERRK